MRISAIVCVYNRQDTLPDCLSALVSQTLPSQDYEIIVIDNNSTDMSGDIAKDFASRHNNIFVFNESKQGLAAARNCGLRNARSPIAAFTDDDAIPASSWLKQLVQRFASLGDEVAAVGGELVPVWRGPKPDWLDGTFLLHPLSVCLGWSTTPRLLTASEWLCEANSAYRIAPLMARNGFPEELGRIGNNLLSGENAVNELLRSDGFSFYFDPSILVEHQIHESRMTRDWFRRRFFWQGVTKVYVNQYLSKCGCPIEAFTDVMLPMDEPSWAAVLGRGHPAGFEQSLHYMYGLGFALASSKLLTGR